MCQASRAKVCFSLSKTKNMKTTRIFFLVIAFFSYCIVLNAQTEGCNIQNPENLTWVQNLIDNQSCDCNQSLEYHCYNDQGIFILSPQQPNNCADYQTIVYDTEGGVLCTIGGFIGSTCEALPGIENSTLISQIWSCANNCICTAEYAPVCGSDGNTYSNACVANCAGVSWTDGPCASTCSCEELANKKWVMDLIANETSGCLEKVDLVTYEGNTAVLFDGLSDCNAWDYPDILYDCNGNTLCLWGEVLPEDFCTGPTTHIQNIWQYENGFSASCVGLTESFTICNGSSIEIGQDGFLGNTIYTWTPNSSLSCISCPNPIASPTESTIYQLKLFTTIGQTTEYLYYQVIVEEECTNIACDFSWELVETIGTNANPPSFYGIYNFTDNIFTDNICGWEWDFGNGNITTVADPSGISFLFEENNTTADPYNVCLTVTECGGESYTCCKELNPYDNGTNAICGITDVYSVPFLQPYLDNCNYEAIYSFVIDGTEYVYVVSDGICEHPGGLVSVIEDLGNILYDCEGNYICNVGGFTTIESQCSFIGIDVNPYVIPSNIIWQYKEPECICTTEYAPVCGVDGFTYSNECYAACEGVEVAYEGVCGAGPGFCGVENVSELPFLQSYIDDCFYNAIYSFVINGQEVIYVNATSSCTLEDGSVIFIADLGSALLDCQGNYICNDGGFTTPESQCSFQGYDIQPFLTPENIVWSADNTTELFLKANIYLQSAYSDDGLMKDDLRTKNVIPLEEPFTALPGFNHAGSGGGETIDKNLLDISGNNGIIDWVLIELHDDASNNLRTTSSALLQRDGDIVDTDGVSDVKLNAPEGNYRVSVKHRNHLGVTTKNALTFIEGVPTESDFNTIETFGQDALVELPNGKKALWGGSIGTDKIVFQGPDNTPNAIFFEVLLAPENTTATPNYIYKDAYNNTDLDMNGETIFQGINNDVNIAFFTVLMHPGNVNLAPNFIIYEQKP